MDKNIIGVISLIVILVAISVGILFWQKQDTGTTSPSPTTSTTPVATPTPTSDPDSIIDQQINAAASVSFDDQFKDIDTRISSLGDTNDKNTANIGDKTKTKSKTKATETPTPDSGN